MNFLKRFKTNPKSLETEEIIPTPIDQTNLSNHDNKSNRPRSGYLNFNDNHLESSDHHNKFKSHQRTKSLPTNHERVNDVNKKLMELQSQSQSRRSSLKNHRLSLNNYNYNSPINPSVLSLNDPGSPVSFNLDHHTTKINNHNAITDNTNTTTTATASNTTNNTANNTTTDNTIEETTTDSIIVNDNKTTNSTITEITAINDKSNLV